MRRRIARSGVGITAVLLVAACGGSDATESEATDAPDAVPVTTAAPATTDVPTTVAAPSTTIATTTSGSTTTTSTTTTSTTTTTAPEPPADPAEACRSYVGELAGVLETTAAILDEGAVTVTQLEDGTLPIDEGSIRLASLADGFAGLTQQLIDLGEPPAESAAAAALVGEALELFESAATKQSQGATGDAALLDEGAAELDAGAALLSEVPAVLPDCAAVGTPDGGAEPGSTELATPSDTDLTVFFRLAESLFESTGSPYLGTSEAVLTESAQAACRVLLAGGSVREAIDATIASSPVAGQTFGAPEQQYVLLAVTRGAALWCPSVVADEAAFSDEVISTIVDVFFEG